WTIKEEGSLQLSTFPRAREGQTLLYPVCCEKVFFGRYISMSQNNRGETDSSPVRGNKMLSNSQGLRYSCIVSCKSLYSCIMSRKSLSSALKRNARRRSYDQIISRLTCAPPRTS
ncbi:unnamed protein product, partial [Ectocarpus sp. 4 AP-2014]